MDFASEKYTIISIVPRIELIIQDSRDRWGGGGGGGVGVVKGSDEDGGNENLHTCNGP